MNKKNISLLIILFISTLLFSQNNYRDYNLKCYYARKLAYHHKLDSALLVYKEAFKLVDFVHIENLEKAQKLAKKLKDSDYNSYLTELIEQRNKKTSIDTAYAKLIDRLYKEDQRVRRNEGSSEARRIYYEYIEDSTLDKSNEEFIRAEVLMKEWLSVDSTNISILLSKIKEVGFPSEKLIGNDGYDEAVFILLHYDSDYGNKVLKPIIDSALQVGDIEPEDYAWIVDRRRAIPYYFKIPPPENYLTEEMIKEINERRRLIGLRKLNEGVKVIYKKEYTQVKILY